LELNAELEAFPGWIPLESMHIHELLDNEVLAPAASLRVRDWVV
jgi:hypothetical protein